MNPPKLYLMVTVECGGQLRAQALFNGCIDQGKGHTIEYEIVSKFIPIRYEDFGLHRNSCREVP